MSDPASTPAIANPVIQRCVDAWNRIYKPAVAKGELAYIAARPAGAAFRACMPELTTPADIRDFIACVARGILLGAIEEKQAARLIGTAQIAIRAFRRDPNAPTEKNSEKNL